MIHQLDATLRCKTAEMRAFQEVVSTHKGAYIDVRDCVGAELRRRNATHIRRFLIL